ncbi:MAG: hypothetical protein Solumvirus2_46 [Solumvirus sp.]|uniref:Uncharacterized protein n=1 Tax=Solumvirus sp. TaxID=2487773 RepID=A0A3G5AKA5_9VIRU|nr:MAG: hypothetical protein Solumvirus2_46 [Solumvirus sp.]
MSTILPKDDPTNDNVTRLLEEAKSSQRVLYQEISDATIKNPKSYKKIERRKTGWRRGKGVIFRDEEVDVDPILFVGYDYKIKKNNMRMALDADILPSSITEGFIHTMCSINSEEAEGILEGPRIPNYINLPAPLEIRQDITPGKYTSSHEGKICYGSYVSSPNGYVVKHGIFHNFYLDGTIEEYDGIFDYFYSEYDMGLIKNVMIYNMEINEPTLTIKIIFDDYGYINKIESRDRIIEVDGDISYVFEGGNSGTDGLPYVYTWLSFKTNKPVNLDDVAPDSSDSPPSEDFPGLDGIALFTVQKHVFKYTIDSLNLDKSQFYKSVVGIILEIKRRLSLFKDTLSSFIPISGIQDIIVNYAATRFYNPLRNNLTKIQKILLRYKDDKVFSDELVEIERVLEAWPKY